MSPAEATKAIEREYKRVQETWPGETGFWNGYGAGLEFALVVLTGGASPPPRPKGKRTKAKR